MIEDTAGYKEMVRMNHGNFCEILGMIEPYITPKDILGATEVIKAPERLALTIRFLATGETYHYHLVKCSICLNSQWIRWALRVRGLNMLSVAVQMHSTSLSHTWMTAKQRKC